VPTANARPRLSWDATGQCAVHDPGSTINDLYYSLKYVTLLNLLVAAWGSVVVKALLYKLEDLGIDSRCRRGFFPWHLTVPFVLKSTQPLKMSTCG